MVTILVFGVAILGSVVISLSEVSKHVFMSLQEYMMCCTGLNCLASAKATEQATSVEQVEGGSSVNVI